MATNRIRKHLQYEGGDGTGSGGTRVNENFCLIGTPLPSLESTKRDVNEFKPVWQQEAYDEQGRRRFHGAFTGGWSAGYFNTVGSKEGWTPGTFRSSRKDKDRKATGGGGSSSSNRRTEQSVDDFMDDEDKADLREGRGALRTSQVYGGRGDELAQTTSYHDPLLGILDGVPSGEPRVGYAPLGVEVSPTSLGTKILQSMGWKQGQGIGPRISAARRRSMQRSLGLPLTETDDEHASAHVFPPPDTPLVQAQGSNAKQRHGLGWDASDRPATLEEILQRRRTNDEQRGEEKERRRGGFGIGALENDSDGEEDVYDAGLTARDSTLNNKLDRRTRKDIRQGNVAHRERDADKENVWHDGKPMIPGYRISQVPYTSVPWFAAPTVPKDWQPDPQRVWSRESVQQQDGSIQVSTTTLGPGERASMLGEARAPGPPPLITDYLNSKARERVERAKEERDETVRQDSLQTSVAKATPVPRLDQATAQAALRGYIPFAGDDAKQKRYRSYLTSQADPALDVGKLDIVDRNELNEFAKSAMIFKPMSTVMATRFESSHSDAGKGVSEEQRHVGLYVPERKADVKKGENEVAEVTEERDERDSKWNSLPPARRNARMGLFGPGLTRTSIEWRPSRMLCKRFNVPMPYAENETDELDSFGSARSGRRGEETFDEFGESKGRTARKSNVNARWESSKRELQQLAESRAWESNVREAEDVQVEEQTDDNHTSKIGKASLDLDNVGFGDQPKEGEETTYVRPPMSLFKAIFHDDDDEPEENVKRNADSTTPKEANRPPQDVFRPTFVPRKRASAATTDNGQRNETTTTTKSSAKKKPKRAAQGMLTFNMDDEDGEQDGIVEKRKKKNKKEEEEKPSSSVELDVSARSSTQSRIRAADLFD